MKFKVLHRVFENRLRNYFVLMGIAVCFMAITTVDGMLSYMVLERKNEVKRFENKILIQPYSSEYPAVRSIIKEESVTSSLKIPGVNQEESSPLLWIPIRPGEDPMDTAEIMGIGIKPGCEENWIESAQIASGKRTLLREPDHSVILGNKAAKYFDTKSAGETIFFSGERWQVSGILHEAGTKFLVNTDDLVIMKLQNAQSAFKMQGMISEMLIATDKEAIDAVSNVLSVKYPYLEISSRQGLQKLMKKELELPSKFLGLVSLVSFFTAIMIMINLLVMGIQEKIQKPEAIITFGTSQSAIIKHTFIEAEFIAAFGGLIGVVAAMPAAYIFYRYI